MYVAEQLLNTDMKLTVVVARCGGVVGTVVGMFLTIQQNKSAVLDGNIMEIRAVLFQYVHLHAEMEVNVLILTRVSVPLGIQEIFVMVLHHVLILILAILEDAKDIVTSVKPQLLVAL